MLIRLFGGGDTCFKEEQCVEGNSEVDSLAVVVDDFVAR